MPIIAKKIEAKDPKVNAEIMAYTLSKFCLPIISL